ncbi:MAG: L-serine ammonia-lyase, iron-sulfur-dependent, subunit alpha [Paludibacteraceae bacterium]|nr:L-serine ammonia-lyase, iron-sulfur-dependent, subunit alpha [Paludibacteraceae bacterium]
MTQTLQIIELIQREVLPAIGCTEPIAVALAVAKASETLGSVPQKITARLSANIIKNAMGVGIPGTGMVGLPIAIALGATIGKSEYQLEVLRDCTPEAVENGRKMIADGNISVELKPTDEKLYIEIEVQGNGHSAIATIASNHTNFVHIERDGKVLLDKECCPNVAVNSSDIRLNMRMVYDFAMETPLDDIRFILESKQLNDAVSRHSLGEKYGHEVGRAMTLSPELFGETIYAHVVGRTAAAADARMDGCPMAVMSNSGSGNQGIAATMPVVAFADDVHASEEQLIRALTLSHLTAIFIKQNLGRLSALCGCVVASTGSACGITYLMGGTYDNICHAVKNMVATLTGMLCDGAKPSCALKLATGVSTALMCAKLAMNGHFVSSIEGIVDDSVDKSVCNMTSVGRDGMLETDKLVLNIMTNK